MEITVRLADDLTEHPNPGREALEALAIQGYRAGSLSHLEAGQLLGLSRLLNETTFRTSAALEQQFLGLIKS